MMVLLYVKRFVSKNAAGVAIHRHDPVYEIVVRIFVTQTAGKIFVENAAMQISDTLNLGVETTKQQLQLSNYLYI
jgi:hypothetical protein